MKSDVYYFTGTGNSLVVAKDIAKEVGGELISIASVIDKNTIKISANTIVIVFPVYIFGIPLIIERFIKKIENISDKYIYAIATNGGMPGATINILEKVIKNSNGKLSAGFTVSMPGNYTPMYGAIPEEKQKKMFDNWNKRINFIAEYIKSNKSGIKENSNFIANLIFSSILYKVSSNKIPKMDEKFWADEKCNKCGTCQKLCPVANIHMDNGKPSWNGNCEQCFACLQWCPKEAIQYGKKTSTRKRYHHPEINISDILNQAKR